MMKPITKVSIAVLCVSMIVLVMFFWLGRSKTYKADYIKMYAAFLDYSLGADNWALADSELREQAFADFAYYYHWWRVEYTDSLGVRRSLRFNNYTGSTPNDTHFANSVTKAAAEITRDRIEKAITPQYMGSGADSSMDFYMLDYPLFQKQNSNLSFDRPVLSITDGLRLYDYDTAWIFGGHRFFLEVTGSFEDEALYARAAGSLYSEIRDFVKTDPDVLIDLSLHDTKTGAVLESRQIAYIGGTALIPEPAEGQEAVYWFQGVLQERYFPLR